VGTKTPAADAPSAEAVDTVASAMSDALQSLSLAPEPQQREAAIGSAAADYTPPPTEGGQQDLHALLAMALTAAGISQSPQAIIDQLVAQSRPLVDRDGEPAEVSAEEMARRQRAQAERTQVAYNRGSTKERATRQAIMEAPLVSVGNHEDRVVCVNNVSVHVKAGWVTVPAPVANIITLAQTMTTDSDRFRDWLRSGPSVVASYDRLFGAKRPGPATDYQIF